MEIWERNFAFAFRTPHTYDRVERGERDAHVARMRGDTFVALTEDCVDAVESFKRAATAAGFAFVALRKRRVVKIIAARTLKHVSANGCHVSQLWARA